MQWLRTIADPWQEFETRCSSAQKRGWHTCPSKSIPAGEIERFVIDQIKCIGKDPTLVNETFAEARAQGKALIVDLETELRGLKRDLGQWNAEVRKVVVSELRDDTFYAVIWMDHAGETVAMDARPSDAIALALRWDCPIYVNREVLENSKQAAGSQNVNADEMRRWLENLNDDDMGRYKM